MSRTRGLDPKIERLLAKQLGVDWTKYDRDVSSK
jgi:hypothetical protein